jgi:hypothetical protein
VSKGDVEGRERLCKYVLRHPVSLQRLAWTETAGRRARGALVVVNCGAIPRELVESENYDGGRGVPLDKVRATELFERACAGGLPAGCGNLGIAQRDGFRGTKDPMRGLKGQVRAQLSFVLQGVLTQLLLPRAAGPGRVLALEVMVPNPAIRNLIREDKVHQIYSQMQVGQDKYGMQTLNQSLYSLLQRRLISLEEALGRSSDQDELRNMLEGRSVLPLGQQGGHVRG